MQWLIELQIALPFEFCDIYASILSSYLVHLDCTVTNKCHVFLFWEKKRWGQKTTYLTASTTWLDTTAITVCQSCRPEVNCVSNSRSGESSDSITDPETTNNRNRQLETWRLHWTEKMWYFVWRLNGGRGAKRARSSSMEALDEAGLFEIKMIYRTVIILLWRLKCYIFEKIYRCIWT